MLTSNESSVISRLSFSQLKKNNPKIKARKIEEWGVRLPDTLLRVSTSLNKIVKCFKVKEIPIVDRETIFGAL